MTDSTSILAVHNDGSNEKKTIYVKTSISKEIYHGSELKSRIEYKVCREIPSDIDGNLLSSLPVDFENKLEKPRKKLKVKKQNIAISNKNKEEKQNYILRCINICSIIFFISVLLGSFIPPYIFSDVALLVDKVGKELHAKILNQNSSIVTVIDSLEDLYKPPRKKILTCLVGPTGVGKSYLVNILSEQISPHFINILHSSHLNDFFVDEKINKSYTEHLQKLNSPFFIIVIDDIKPSDFERLKKFIEIIFSIEDLNILILTVFNIETEDCLKYSSKSIINPIFFEEILKDLSEHLYFTHFKFLNESIVRLWLKKKLAVENIKPEIQGEIINNLLKKHDIKCHGLKGLHSKLLIELSKYDKLTSKHV